MDSEEGRLRLRPVLQNPYEVAADKSLEDIARSNGVRLLPKVGLKDAIDIDQRGAATPSEKNFALKAHLDFLLVEESNSVPLLAIEIDGAAHSTDLKQRARDRMKDELCRRASLPLVRVNSEFAKRAGRYSVLEYVCEVFFRGRAFNAAQERGEIPPDEPFVPASFIDMDMANGRAYFGSFDGRARVSIMERHKRGEVTQSIPDTWLCSPDERGNVRCDAFLAITRERCLIASAVVREFGIYGFSSSELAEEVAVADLASQLDKWTRDEPVGLNARSFQSHFRSLLTNNRVDGVSGYDRAGARGPLPYPAYRITWAPTYEVTIAPE